MLTEKGGVIRHRWETNNAKAYVAMQTKGGLGIFLENSEEQTNYSEN
jgi:hypothetical protein